MKPSTMEKVISLANGLTGAGILVLEKDAVCDVAIIVKQQELVAFLRSLTDPEHGAEIVKEATLVLAEISALDGAGLPVLHVRRRGLALWALVDAPREQGTFRQVGGTA